MRVKRCSLSVFALACIDTESVFMENKMGVVAQAGRVARADYHSYLDHHEL